MSSPTIKVRKIPKAMAVFFDILLCSRPVFLGYQILALTVFLVAIALENNNYIGRAVLYWIVGTSMLFSYTWLVLAPWVNSQTKLILMLVLIVVLFKWW
ncbi:MAG: hypothetical protein CVV11_18235 [Gammaproteobacteria bacterium HGW-Gammaproteobacteria-15]|nr:MAG: hypothetical protein CVV11_18235 [Gammaproteobacteria bacterium HGW-Gammaproteobacteria-15]